MDYNNEMENFKPYKKESVFKKHGFLMGVLSTLLCVVLVCGLVFGLLNATGQILVIGQTGASTVEGEALLSEETVEKLDEIYQNINIYYYEDFEKTDLEESLYKGLVEGLNDPYSVYYTEEEYEDLMVSTTGTYYGIGAGLSQNLDTMVVTITKVYRGTPAEEAGLKNGDIILAVDEWDATSMEVSKLVQHIRGEAGTTVHMTIYRESTGETLEFDVERRHVELPSIEGEMLEGGIGYIQITEFQSKTDEQFEEMLESFRTQGMNGLIVDVRANPGGLLSSVVNLCDYILPQGLVVYIEDTFGNKEEYNSDKRCIDIPMVVLIDENSASASEIFAAAMKDYQYATLVGKTTYGKGIVQNIIPLDDGDALKLTTAKYFTPNGNYIHEVGVSPDVEIDYEYTGPDDATYDKQYDSQFLKAVEVMQGMLAK
ncbi:MAG: S41 family peptidase [Agathobacter sp.]|nr:S41 family peptidase [Agathobacter sp.]